MKLDVLGHMGEQGGEDSKLQAAWETASQFKKRYMEHKAELDTIRLAAARMQVRAWVGVGVCKWVIQLYTAQLFD
jgi:hypothetical protein